MFWSNVSFLFKQQAKQLKITLFKCIYCFNLIWLLLQVFSVLFCLSIIWNCLSTIAEYWIDPILLNRLTNDDSFFSVSNCMCLLLYLYLYFCICIAYCSDPIWFGCMVRPLALQLHFPKLQLDLWCVSLELRCNKASQSDYKGCIYLPRSSNVSLIICLQSFIEFLTLVCSNLHLLLQRKATVIYHFQLDA